MRLRHRRRAGKIHRKRTATSLSYQLRMPFGYFIFGRSSNLNINAKSHAHSGIFVMPYQQKCEVEKNISSKIWSLCIDESLEITLEFHNFGFGVESSPICFRYKRELFDGDFLHNCKSNPYVTQQPYVRKLNPKLFQWLKPLQIEEDLAG